MRYNNIVFNNNVTVSEMLVNVSIDQIRLAANTVELEELVERAASDLGCVLDNSLTYGENAEWFEQASMDGVSDMAEILRIAETRWFELEG